MLRKIFLYGVVLLLLGGLLFAINDSGHAQLIPNFPVTTGGPDKFGYTWDDTVPLDWIDASSGIDTGIRTNRDYTGAIDIGFPFKFYENTYTQLYISFYGYVSFNDNEMLNEWSDPPSFEEPNDVIAPRWSPADYVDGYVRYLRGGTAPDRWFVVEWNRIIGDSKYTPDDYTYEVILHENGDIVFQYGSMNTVSGYWCQPSGIEDSTGLDGLAVTFGCSTIESYHAVHIYRPEPAVRFKVITPYKGSFVKAGETKTFEITLRNKGDFGPDTFDLVTSSGWPVSLYDATGNHLLTDTDDDGILDTGSVSEATSLTLIAKVKTPVVTNVGDDDTTTITVTSSLDPNLTMTATLQTAVPAPFAQAFVNDLDAAMSLYLVKPDSQTVMKVTDDNYHGRDMALAASSNGFVYVWTVERNDDDGYWNNIEYTLLNRQGNTIYPVTTLTDNADNATDAEIHDYPAVAVAPDGNIGIVWERSIYDYQLWKSNYNIFYTILDASGNIIVPITNLTNNNEWTGYHPFDSPKVIATDDNHFFISWLVHGSDKYSYECDVFTSVIDSLGNPIQGPVNRTDNPEDYASLYSSTTPMDGNQVLLAYSRDTDLGYIVLDSNGNVVLGESMLPDVNFGEYVDTVRLSNGRILMAWMDYTSSSYYTGPRARFIILDASGASILYGPTMLDPAPKIKIGYLTGIGPETEYGMSVVADHAGNAILSWGISWYRTRQYFALVDNDGSVLTQPTIFLQPDTIYPYSLWVNPEVASIAPYSQPPTGDGVDNQVWSLALATGASGGMTNIPIGFSNHGAAAATELVISVTLPISLTYISDTSGITPTITGDTLAWNLPSLGFLGSGFFSAKLNLPVAPVGTIYPVTIAVHSSQPDGNPEDNTLTLPVMIANQLFLPLARR